MLRKIGVTVNFIGVTVNSDFAEAFCRATLAGVKHPLVIIVTLVIIAALRNPFGGLLML